MASTKSQLRELIERLAKQNSDLPNPTLRDLQAALAAARRIVDQRWEKWLLQAGDLNGQFTKKLYKSLIRELHGRGIVGPADWAKDVQKALLAALLFHAQRVMAHARDQQQRDWLALGGYFGATHLLPAVPLEDLEDGVDAAARAEERAKHLAENMWNDLKRLLLILAARGVTLGKMQERLARLGGPGKMLTPMGGVLRRHKHWLDRIAIDEAIALHNLTYAEILRLQGLEDPGLVKRWDATMDAKVCVVCASLDGEVREIDEPFHTGMMGPQAHSRCRCTLMTWYEDWGKV